MSASFSRGQGKVYNNLLWSATTKCEKIMEALSLRLKELRGARSQSAFARELGITQQRYANYESGIREPDLTTLCRIAALTTGSVDKLLGVKELKPDDRVQDKVADLKQAIITLLKEY